MECLWPAGEGGQAPGLREGPGSPGVPERPEDPGPLEVPEHPEGHVSLGGHTAPDGQRAEGGRCKTPCPRSHCCSARRLPLRLRRPVGQARGRRSGAAQQIITLKQAH